MLIKKRYWILFALGLVLWGNCPLYASFHLMEVQEVFPGTVANPSSQYVMLKMYSPGQNFTNGARVRLFDASGVFVADFATLPDVANGASGDNILVGTSAAAGLLGLPMDATASAANIPFPSGRVCFTDSLLSPLDCVAYGNFTGNNSPYGTPAAALVRDFALRRTINRDEFCTVGCNNSTAFSILEAAPRNNARSVLSDSDGDGAKNPLDCAINDGTAKHPQPAVQKVMLTKALSANITWNDHAALYGSGTRYNVIRGPLENIISGNYGGATCLINTVQGSSTTDPVLSDPNNSNSYYYLIRGQHACGPGTYGSPGADAVACQAGSCTGACVASDQCHEPGVCDPLTGVCSNPPKANGTGCNDSNDCTQTDTCQAGSCTGSLVADGTNCNDGNLCTGPDTCQAGSCTGSPVSDGTVCTGEEKHCSTDPDTCRAGVCVASASLCLSTVSPFCGKGHVFDPYGSQILVGVQIGWVGVNFVDPRASDNDVYSIDVSISGDLICFFTLQNADPPIDCYDIFCTCQGNLTELNTLFSVIKITCSVPISPSNFNLELTIRDPFPPLAPWYHSIRFRAGTICG